MRVIKIKRLLISPVYGNMGEGDLVRCDDAFAAHCVDDLDAAEYVEGETEPPAAPGPVDSLVASPPADEPIQAPQVDQQPAKSKK